MTPRDRGVVGAGWWARLLASMGEHGGRWGMALWVAGIAAAAVVARLMV